MRLPFVKQGTIVFRDDFLDIAQAREHDIMMIRLISMIADISKLTGGYVLPRGNSRRS